MVQKDMRHLRARLVSQTALVVSLAAILPCRAQAQTPAPQSLPAVVVQAPAERKKAPTRRVTVARATKRSSAKRHLVTPVQAAQATSGVPSSSSTIRSTLAGGSAGETATGPVVGYKANRSATATKTDTPIRDVPQSIQVVPRQVIEDQGATSVEEVVRNVSGVIPDFSAGGRSQSFSLRGFGSAQTATDGVLNNRLFGEVGTRDLVDVERVEVLKGPSSVLFGQNPPGGLINFVSKQPTARPYFSGEATGGSYGYARATLDASAPFATGSDFSYRLNMAYDHDDTFRRPTATPTERFTIAPVIQWKPSNATTVTAEVYNSEQRRQFDRGLVALGNRVIDTPVERYFGEAYNKTSSSSTEARLRLDQIINESWSARVITRAGSGEGSSVGYAADTFEADRRTLDRGGFMIDDHFVSLSAEADLIGHVTTGDLGHTLILGTEINRSQRNSDNSRFFDIPSLDVFNPIYTGVMSNLSPSRKFYSHITETSAYAEDQIALPFNVKLVVGGRYDADRQVNGDDASAAVGQNDSAFSPRVGLVWQPFDFTSFYASYSTSFTPNSGLTRDGAGLAPTTAEQYEVGAKFDFLDNRLSTTIAAFDITETNVATTDPVNPDFTILTGAVRGRGFEFDTAGQLTDAWRIISSFAYIDAAVTRDNVIPVGNRVQNVPRFSGSLWSTYEYKVGPLQGLGFGAGVFAMDERPGDPDNSFTVPAFYRLDASAWYKVNEHTRVQLNIKNLTDRRYLESTASDGNIIPGAPLTVTGSVRVTF